MLDYVITGDWLRERKSLMRIRIDRSISLPHVRRLSVRLHQVERQRRSWALTALATGMLSGISEEKAAKQVTDRMGDDGIDGFAVLECQAAPPAIYLVQAKWSAKGNYNFRKNDVQSLVDGFQKLRTWDDLDPRPPVRSGTQRARRQATAPAAVEDWLDKNN
jgi:hypothetical protein